VRKKVSWIEIALAMESLDVDGKKGVAGKKNNGSNSTDEGQWALEHLLLPLPRRCLSCDKLIKRQTFAGRFCRRGQGRIFAFYKADPIKIQIENENTGNRERPADQAFKITARRPGAVTLIRGGPVVTASPPHSGVGMETRPTLGLCNLNAHVDG